MTVVPRDLRWSVSCTAKSILLQFDAHLMELLRERLCLDPVVLRAAILWGYCFTVSLFFSCQGVRVSEGGMLIKVVHRLFVRGILWVVQTSDVSLVLFYIPRHVVCCDCIAIVWIAMGLVGLYEQRKQFLCVWQLWVVQYQLQWMPLPLALVPCIPLSVFVSCSGRPQLVRGGFGPPFWRGFMALQSHKLYDSPIVTPPWSRLTFLPRLAVIWMLV